MKKKDRLFIGTSGFNYAHWGGGVFYPSGLAQKRWLEHYAEFFSTVELNVTFYRLPKETAFKGWRERVPPGFVFAVKGSRFITHQKKLQEVEDSIDLFFRRSLLLGDALGVILWQLPPSFGADKILLDEFTTRIREITDFPQAFEFRNSSWFNQDIEQLLAEKGMAICEADWPGLEQYLPQASPLVYIRRHGPLSGSRYQGCYDDGQLKSDGRRIKSALKAGKTVFIFFNNDAQGYAIANARQLKKLVE